MFIKEPEFAVADTHNGLLVGYLKVTGFSFREDVGPKVYVLLDPMCLELHAHQRPGNDGGYVSVLPMAVPCTAIELHGSFNLYRADSLVLDWLMRARLMFERALEQRNKNGFLGSEESQRRAVAKFDAEREKAKPPANDGGQGAGF